MTQASLQQRPCVVQWSDLTSLDWQRQQSAQDSIKQAFATPDALGVIAVAGIPEVTDMRAYLLPQAAQLASLPADILQQYMRPGCKYIVGWSHGQERLQNGKPDILKGSFYVNLSPAPSGAESCQQRTGTHEANVWPSQELPELEPALLAFSQCICEVATALLAACQRIVHKARLDSGDASGTAQQQRPSEQGHACCATVNAECQASAQGPGHDRQRCDADTAAGDVKSTLACIAPALEAQHSNKARLLHYFPVPDATATPEAWCGWHFDHGTITGLTSSMYLPAQLPTDTPAHQLAAHELDCPNDTIGLHVRKRNGQVVRVTAPRDQLMFQAGQCLEILSGGRLRATEHYVRGPGGPMPVSRSTFAVFCQPNDGDILEPAECGLEAMQQLQDSVHRWRPGMTFAEFAKATITDFYE